MGTLVMAVNRVCRPGRLLASNCHRTARVRLVSSDKGCRLPAWVETEAEHLWRNRETCRENVANRKGRGDVDKVAGIWDRLQSLRPGSERCTETVALEEELRPGSKRCSETEALEEELRHQVLRLPNRTHPSTPAGEGSQPSLVDTSGEPPHLAFPVKGHMQLGEQLGILRYLHSDSHTGPRSYYLLGAGAQLEEALVRLSLDHLRCRGFPPVSVSDVVGQEVFEGCGMADRDWLYRLRHAPDLCLSGTAEIGIASQYSDCVLPAESLPLRLCAISTCFRAEVGAQEVRRSLYRVHQFTKVEMFVFTASESGRESEEALQEVVGIQREVLDQLGIHYRLLNMPAWELGAPAYQKYDIEAWMPQLGDFGEVTSASNCTDYQSRRLNMRYRRADGSLALLHTVNGTACAIPRVLLTLMECNQQQDGSIAVPRALQPYMDGITLIQKQHGLSGTRFPKF